MRQFVLIILIGFFSFGMFSYQTVQATEEQEGQPVITFNYEVAWEVCYVSEGNTACTIEPPPFSQPVTLKLFHDSGNTYSARIADFPVKYGSKYVIDINVTCSKDEKTGDFGQWVMYASAYESRADLGLWPNSPFGRLYFNKPLQMNKFEIQGEWTRAEGNKLVAPVIMIKP